MKRHGYVATLLAVLVVVILAAGCAPSATPTPAATQAPAATKPASATQVPAATQPPSATKPASASPTAASQIDPDAKIVIAQASDATTLDPNADTVIANHNIQDSMFNMLVERDSQGKFVPGLALSWQNTDAKTWTFVLRKDVKFHNGNPFTAQDVKFTYDRIQSDKALASKMAGNISTITQTTVVDDFSITFKTTDPDPTFLARVAEVPIVDKETVEKMGLEAFAKAPVGTGPFKFVEWKKDQQVVMERYDSYWKGKAAFKTLVWRPIAEPAVAVSELQLGTIDIAYQQVTIDSLPQIEAQGNKAIGVPSVRMLYGVFDMSKKPVNDPKVRLAITYGIDLDTIIKDLLKGHAARISQPVGALMFGYNPALKPFPYDVAKAKQLLAEAGYPSGFSMDCETRTAFKSVLEVVAAQLSKIGVQCNIIIDDTTVHLSKVTSKKTEPFFLWSWGNSTMDADGVTYRMMRTGQLYSLTSLPELDKLVDRAHVIMDQTERQSLYTQAHQLIYDQAPLVNMYQTESLYGISKKVTWQPRQDEKVDFFAVTKTR